MRQRHNLTSLQKNTAYFFIWYDDFTNKPESENIVPEKEVIQERAVDTRQSLKECFIAAITKNGYANTSISLVAERANSSVGAFQNHFGTKKAAIELFWNEYCEAAISELKQIEEVYGQLSSLIWLGQVNC